MTLLAKNIASIPSSIQVEDKCGWHALAPYLIRWRGINPVRYCVIVRNVILEKLVNFHCVSVRTILICNFEIVSDFGFRAMDLAVFNEQKLTNGRQRTLNIEYARIKPVDMGKASGLIFPGCPRMQINKIKYKWDSLYKIETALKRRMQSVI